MSFFCCVGHKNYVAKARTKVTIKPTTKRIMALQKTMENSVHIDLFKGITTFKKKVTNKAVADAYAKKDYSALMDTVPWDDMDEHFQGFSSGINASALKAGAFAIGEVPVPKNQHLRYDAKNPELKSFIGNKTGELITQIKAESKANVQSVVERSFTQALTPDRVADQIRSSIGLGPRYQKAVDNYREKLEKQKGATPAMVEKHASAYAERLLSSRAMMIARTETKRATNFGQLSVWKEGQKQGFIGDKAKKVWIVNGDPCDICEPMDGEEVGLNESWILDDGTDCDIPTDSHPNCNCLMELSFEGEDGHNQEDEDEDDDE